MKLSQHQKYMLLLRSSLKWLSLNMIHQMKLKITRTRRGRKSGNVTTKKIRDSSRCWGLPVMLSFSIWKRGNEKKLSKIEKLYEISLLKKKQQPCINDFFTVVIWCFIVLNLWYYSPLSILVVLLSYVQTWSKIP